MSDQPENDKPQVDFVYSPSTKDLVRQTAVPLLTMGGLIALALGALAGIGTVAEKIQARKDRKNDSSSDETTES